MTELVPFDDHLPGRRKDTVLPRTAERILQGVPENTQRSYAKVFERFEAWCVDNQRQPVPTTAATLADYVTYLCDLGRAPSTISHAMAIISVHNQTAGYPSLGKKVTKAASLALRGYRREVAEQGRRVKEAPPITMDVLRRMSAACDPATLAGKRDRLLLVLSMALASRRSEAAALRMQDVEVDNDELVVLIRKSKTDQDAQGRVAYIPRGIHVDTDAVGLYMEWINALQALGVDTSTGYLFRAVTRHGKLYNHHRLSEKAINDIVRRVAVTAHLPNSDRYTAHSLRAGYMTQTAWDGIPTPIAAEDGGWAKNSTTAAKYVRDVDKRRNNPRRKMGF